MMILVFAIKLTTDLLQEVRSFVSASKSQDNVAVLERSKSAIILMRSLPCARAAVLEQICEIFQQAVHKHIVESDRQDLLGTAQVTDVDPEVYDVIQSIYDTLLEFINKNPEAWAPIIAKWSVYLLGQLSTTYTGLRGTKPNVTLNEKLQIWMTCPAIQMLMEISAQCFSKLINSNPDVCISCLLDSAVKHSPHFDWVVAYIGSYFYKSIINHLLNCALKEFHNQASNDEEVSLLLVTAIRMLDYLALQYPHEVQNSILAMFQESVTNAKSQICLIPFLIHLGTHAPSVLNVLAITFLDQLSPNVMVKLYFQLTEWGSVKGNLTASLFSSVVGLMISLKNGTYKVFQFLLTISLNMQSSDITEPESSKIVNNIQKFSTILLEQLFVQLQRLVWKKHHATSSPDGSGIMGGSQELSHDIPFLNQIQEHFKDICNELIKTENKNRLSWYLRLLSLVAIYSGLNTSVEILNYIFTFRGTSHTLSLFIQVQKELQSFFPKILDQTLEKCLKNIAIMSSPDVLTQPQVIVENLQKLMELEKTSGKDVKGFSISACIKRHSTSLVSFLPYPNMVIASVTLDIFLAVGFPLPTMTLSDKTKIVRKFVSFFFNLLHDYKSASLENKCDLCFEHMEMLRKCQSMLAMLCQDESCQLLTIRHLMEGACDEENKQLFSNKGQAIEIDCNSADDNTLFNKNLRPGISSRLPLNTASVFYLGIIGKGLRKPTQEDTSQTFSLTSSQLFLQSVYNVFYGRNNARKPNTMETDRGGNETKVLGTLALLMRDLLVLDASFDCISWPDDEIVKYSIERDIKIRKQFDESEILWHLLSLVAEAPHVLPNCISIIHGLFSSIVKFWEQAREPKTTDSPSNLYASVQIMSIMRKAMWLPRPLCLIGEIFHIISPKEVHKLLITTWEFLKENPPTVNTRITTEIKDGQHKDVVKSIFLGNIAELGHLYARFFPVNKT